MPFDRLCDTLIELAGIPSTSGHEEHIRTYLERRLAELGISCQVDEAGNLIGVDLNPGSSGKVSFEIPGSRNLDRSHSTVTHSFSSFRNLTGASGRSLAMSKSFRAWTQMAP